MLIGKNGRLRPMPIIDVQVHAYEHNHPGRPWAAHLLGPGHVTGDETVAAMDAVGVDGALLVSPFAQAAHPGRAWPRHVQRHGGPRPAIHDLPLIVGSL
jgi:hypothetical protein